MSVNLIQRIVAADSSAAQSGFASGSVLYLEARAEPHPMSGPTLVLVVEHSDDGVTWSTAETLSFTQAETQYVAVPAPKNHVRTRWTVTGGRWKLTVNGKLGAASPRVTARAEYSGNATAVVNNNSGDLTWNAKTSGSSLLDLSAPLRPVVLDSGIYAVHVEVIPVEDMTAGGVNVCGLELDADGEDPSVHGSVNYVAASLRRGVPLDLTYYIPAGGTILAWVANLDGVLDHTYQLRAKIQRIT